MLGTILNISVSKTFQLKKLVQKYCKRVSWWDIFGWFSNTVVIYNSNNVILHAIFRMRWIRAQCATLSMAPPKNGIRRLRSPSQLGPPMSTLPSPRKSLRRRPLARPQIRIGAFQQRTQIRQHFICIKIQIHFEACGGHRCGSRSLERPIERHFSHRNLGCTPGNATHFGGKFRV